MQSLVVPFAAAAWLAPVPLAAVEAPAPPLAAASRQQFLAPLQKPTPGGLFPTSATLAALQPDWLGAPAASKYNPGGAGNAEGNWWTPSKALDTDCEGNRVTAKTVLTQECIYQKKVAEIKARQSISAENGRYKVEKLAAAEQKAEKAAAERAAKRAAEDAKRAKYAAMTTAAPGRSKQ